MTTTVEEAVTNDNERESVVQEQGVSVGNSFISMASSCNSAISFNDSAIWIVSSGKNFAYLSDETIDQIIETFRQQDVDNINVEYSIRQYRNKNRKFIKNLFFPVCLMVR